MNFSTGNDYSFLFGGSSSSNDNSGFSLNDYASIKNGSYGKLMKAYYKAIGEEPKAALVKCLDRCNNLTTRVWGLSRERIFRMIRETEEYFPKLLKVVKATPEYNNAAWLLQYQMESMLDIYKRLI